MPHDLNGTLLQVGDHVMVPAVVKSVQAGDEYCNVSVETLYPMPPYTSGTTITLNTKQVIKVTKPETLDNPTQA